MTIKLIIFDFDGVIINDYPKHYELTKVRIKDLTEEEFKKLFEGNFHEQFKKFGKRITGLHKLDYNEYQKTIRINQKIKDFLQRLSKKYTLGIITSARESGPLGFIKNNKLEGIFSFVYGKKTHKLKTEKFDLALKKFKFSKDECIFITDTLGDILEAKKVNIKSIAIDFGYHEKEMLKRGNPYAIISDFKQVSAIIKRLNKK
jgi:phosphoglycolate phosphatase